MIDVKKNLGGRQVLDGVNLDVAAGRSLVVIGGSGVGKSVTLKCALGIMKPDSGKVLVDGEDVTAANAAERRRLASKFGMLFQGGALFDSLTIWENVAFRLLYAEGVARKDAKARAIETMRKVRLAPEFADRYPVELSGGMQKRASLARAIIARPEIIFFDEPTTGLDPITADAINDLIVEMVKDLGSAAISITHDMASARKIADEIAMLYNGKIIWRGPASSIDSSGDERVDQFIHGRADGPIQAIV
jgi:phospholipid/cholesterol/gamma-HCH transport system ATP-binding protein